jgi:hypothetical protein
MVTASDSLSTEQYCSLIGNDWVALIVPTLTEQSRIISLGYSITPLPLTSFQVHVPAAVQARYIHESRYQVHLKNQLFR